MRTKYLLSFLGLITACAILSAQDTAPVPTASAPLPAPENFPANSSPAMTAANKIKKNETEISQEASAKVGFVFSAPLRQGGTKLGQTEEMNTSISYVASPRIDKDFLLRTGFSYDYMNTGKMPYPGNTLMPVPDTLQSTAAIIGFDMVISDDWLFRFEAAPGIYSDFQNVDSGDFNIPFNVGASWLVSPDFQLIVGGGFNIWNSIPFIPVVGCRWQFADSWTLMAMAPNPRITYQVTDTVGLYVGASLTGGSYRVGNHFGDQNGRPDLNSAIVQVTEVRVGPGVEWKPTPFLNVDLDGGIMAYRSFDYYRDHLTYHNNPAPYLQLGVTGNF